MPDLGSPKINSIVIRKYSDDSRQTGLTIKALPDGGYAPEDLILLTEDAEENGRYIFPAESVMPNGKYQLYGSSGALFLNGEAIYFMVQRESSMSL